MHQLKLVYDALFASAWATCSSCQRGRSNWAELRPLYTPATGLFATHICYPTK
ncbi:MAG: hypothetical protein M3040_17340 [Bacteroidota bacterium]|nr:hypothetical protein [Bacteroidota bacterium]